MTDGTGRKNETPGGVPGGCVEVAVGSVLLTALLALTGYLFALLVKT